MPQSVVKSDKMLEILRYETPRKKHLNLLCELTGQPKRKMKVIAIELVSFYALTFMSQANNAVLSSS